MIFNPVIQSSGGGGGVTGVIPKTSAWTKYSFHYTSSLDFSQKTISPDSQTTISDIVKGSIFYISGQLPAIQGKEVSGSAEELTSSSADLNGVYGRFFVANGNFTMS